MGHYADFRVVDLIGEFSYYSIGEVSVSNKGSVCLFSGFGSWGPWGFEWVGLDLVPWTPGPPMTRESVR